MLKAKKLAAVMAVNIKKTKSDITYDEVIEIARVYVKIHNNIYSEKWDEEEYLKEFNYYIVVFKNQMS